MPKIEQNWEWCIVNEAEHRSLETAIRNLHSTAQQAIFQPIYKLAKLIRQKNREKIITNELEMSDLYYDLFLEN